MEKIYKLFLKQFKYRKQIYQLAKNDFFKENKNSTLGWFWNIIKPAIMICVYWFGIAVGLKAGNEISQYPYFLWLLAGIVPWFYISDMLKGGAISLKKNSYLITKMKFPISLIATFTNISHLFTHLCLLAITILIFLFLGYPLTVYILQLPIYILFAFIFLNLWSYATSFIVAFSKDIYNLIKSFIMPLFWLSGIIWNIEKIDIGWLNIILKINPITYLVTGYRNCFLQETWFFEQTTELLIFIGILFLLAIIAIFSYKKLRKYLSDVL